ncbi:TPA: helix-turn-helix domain-containing protein [Vibrio parahaemolyticus]
MIHSENIQIIKQDGKPAFAVIPYDEYLALAENHKSDEDNGVFIPHEVAKDILINGTSYIAAWRKHLGVSQTELATRMGIKQSAVSQMEKPDINPQRKTLEAVALALGIEVEQLTQ